MINASNRLKKWRKKNGKFLTSVTYFVWSQGDQGEKENDNKHQCQATIKIILNSKDKIEAYRGAEGVGPLDALTKALQEALKEHFSEVLSWRFVALKERVIDKKKGEASGIRIFITATNGKISWETNAISSDIIEASWQALLDSFIFLILKHRSKI